jgi:glycosyltransferase involved in cell wall biosynthesis
MMSDTPTFSMKKISIVIPALNEEEGIANTIKAIPYTELEDMGYQIQTLVVDNGSSDGTGEIARRAGAEVVFEPRRKYGYAYKAAFAKATGEIIATADADMTYPLEDIPKLVKILELENLDFITTNRFADMEKGAMSCIHRFGNEILNISTRILFGLRIKDTQSGMWIFRKNILSQVKLKNNSMAFSEEIKIEACFFLKCAWREIPIRYKARVGQVKLKTWRNGFGNLFYLIKKRITR